MAIKGLFALDVLWRSDFSAASGMRPGFRKYLPPYSSKTTVDNEVLAVAGRAA
jgi:hypothetical protein